MFAQRTIKPMATALIALLSFIALLSPACKSLSTWHRREPPFVVVINKTGQDLHNVELQELPNADRQPARLASVSPLLAGRSYTVQRISGSKPLSDGVLVAWEWRDGRKRNVRVSIAEEIHHSTGLPKEALVFFIMPNGNVNVSIEMLTDEALRRL